MADHYASCGDERKDVFLDVVEDLLDPSTLFLDISVPDNHKSANHMPMDRRFGIRQNLPHEKVFEIKGHSGVSLIGILRHTFEHKFASSFPKRQT